MNTMNTQPSDRINHLFAFQTCHWTALEQFSDKFKTQPEV